LGLSNLGRPLRTSLRPRRKSASAIQDSVISGASSLLEEVRTEPFRFALMTVPHTNDPPGGPTRCPDKYNQPQVKPTHSDVSWLSIIAPIINAGQVKSRKDFLGSAHVQPPRQQRVLPFPGVASNAHALIVATVNAGVKQMGEPWARCLTSKLSGRLTTHRPARLTDEQQKTLATCARDFIPHGPLQRMLGTAVIESCLDVSTRQMCEASATEDLEYQRFSQARSSKPQRLGLVCAGTVKRSVPTGRHALWQ
jgi:hypothetical protein